MSVTDEIKERADIVEIISRYTQLKRAGNSYKGLCPFHSERTPSFVVFPNSGTWHCFGGCATGGDVFTFLMRKENLEFREVLQMLARDLGITLEENERDPDHQQRGSLYDINGVAAQYFQEVLAHHPAAKAARAYLERRAIDAQTSERFQLGFALESWNSLRDFLSARNFSIDQQIAAGLLKRNEERESVYDAFRNRLMIPIRDRQGRVIGFGGRVLDSSLPKYLNTSETALFHKSHVVYGIDLAQQAIRKEDQVVIVEGYMDVIAAHQYGYANVVACMGTALTAEQLKQLQRYTSNYVLALDADAAGQSATIRGLNQARQSLGKLRKPTVGSGGIRMTERLGANLSILSMPEGKDPDEFIRKNTKAWPELVKQAKPLVDFYIEVICSQVDLSSAAGKAQAVTELTPLIAEIEDETERQHYGQRLARLLRIDESTIEMRVQAETRIVQAGIERNSNSDTARQRRPEHRSLEGETGAPNPTNGSISKPTSPTQRQPAPPDHEDHLLTNLLRDPELLFWLAGETRQQGIKGLQPTDLLRIENQEILRSLSSYLAGDEPWDVELYQETLPLELHGRLAHLIAYGAKLPAMPSDALRGDTFKSLVRLRIQRLKNELTQIKFLLDEAQRNQDRESILNFGRTNDQIRREIGHLQHLSVHWNTQKSNLY
ncbi:MAG: DNA primase [Caldilineaceae bacterium]